MSATKTKTTTTKTKEGPVVTTTAVLTSETLVLTKERRLKLESCFLETAHAKAVKVHALLDYAHCTKDQIVAAMYASADATKDTIVVTDRAGSTMKRSLAVAKAWVVLKAGELVEADAVDDVMALLSQIADITPAALDKYRVLDANDKPTGEYTAVSVVLKSGVEFELQPDQGTGESAVAAVLEEYLSERVRGTAADAIDWLRRYKDAVVYANNEKRRSGHNSIAADARKGKGAGETEKPAVQPKQERGARGSYSKGKKGKKGNGKSPVEPTPEAPVEDKRKGKPAKPAKPMTTAEKVATISTKDLIVALTKRVVDYTTPISVEEDKLINLLSQHYETRFLKGVPVGGTLADVKVKGKKRITRMPAPAAPPVKGPATGTTVKPWSTESTPEAALNRGDILSTQQMNALLLTEQARGTITAKKRKQWMQEAFDGGMNNASFRTRLAKLQGRKILTAVAS